MTTATEYDTNWLQYTRPQPMYDKTINRLLKEVYHNSPAENHNLVNDFKTIFINKMNNFKINQFTGLDEFKFHDVIIGCTQYIDDLYIRLNSNLMVLENDYKYHERLNTAIQYYNVDTLDSSKELLIAMPFPYYGDIHPDMSLILDRCLELNIPVHIDGAWITCSKDIVFDFSHPAIQTIGISLSKGLGLGGNRIGLRYSRIRPTGSVTIMNDFNMNCQGLVHTGLHFLNKLPLDYFWIKYEEAYNKICNDFNLKPTKSIHLATTTEGRPVGIRPLLRYLSDK